MEVIGTAETAWVDVVVALAPALSRLALMLTGSTHDAEDLLQSTFARAHPHGDRIAAMAAPGAYLRTVLINEHTSQGRRRRLPVAPLAEASSLPAVTPPPIGEDDVWTHLAALPRQQRAVLVLRYYEDLRDEEIADLIGCRRATVRSHASHGMATLRTLLTSEENR